ncbi:MAG TPA: SDR family oxidoreductase [Burkholderiaceae bacterium]|nr:SDR family oxidoreductase [Burkholderiaceae bacterium]
MEMKGKVIVVTGGASGIGAALVRRFAREGAAGILVADMNFEAAQAVAGEVSPQVKALALRIDVSSEADVQAMIEEASQHFGRVDVLCSNAGIAIGGGVDAPNADWQRIWEVNLMAHVYGARAVLPQMLARGEGYLLQTASAAGLLSHPESATYAVTKHAAVSLAEWLSINYGDKGIRVSCLCPQGVRTPMLMGQDSERQSFLLEGSVSPEQVADDVIAAMRAERFLVLPHPEVHEYLQRKASDVDRWLGGMRKLRAKAEAIRTGKSR